MTITISSLKTTALVDESAPFSCTVSVNGVRAFIASDDGHGGMYQFDALNPRGAKLLTEAHAYAKSLPPLAVKGYSMPNDLEFLISDLVAKEEEVAQVRRWARTGVVYRTPRMNHGEYVTISGVYSVGVKAQILAEHPDADILNESLLGQQPIDDVTAKRLAFEKHVKKLCTRHTVYSLPGDAPLTCRKSPRPYTAQMRQTLHKQYPGVVIYNETITAQRVA